MPCLQAQWSNSSLNSFVAVRDSDFTSHNEMITGKIASTVFIHFDKAVSHMIMCDRGSLYCDNCLL